MSICFSFFIVQSFVSPLPWLLHPFLHASSFSQPPFCEKPSILFIVINFLSYILSIPLRFYSSILSAFVAWFQSRLKGVVLAVLEVLVLVLVLVQVDDGGVNVAELDDFGFSVAVLVEDSVGAEEQEDPDTHHQRTQDLQPVRVQEPVAQRLG